MKILLLSLLPISHAFLTAPPTRAAASLWSTEPTVWDNFVEGAKFRYSLFQQAQGEGYNFKTSTACALAGEYDEEAVRNEIQATIAAHPCVMYTWEASPSCKQAVQALDKMGATVHIVRLDNPWSEGNSVRAEVAKMVGRSSVPMIFIGGEYVGGYDGGVSDEAPGIVEMAFAGTLRPKLQTVGALPMEVEREVAKEAAPDEAVPLE